MANALGGKGRGRVLPPNTEGEYNQINVLHYNQFYEYSLLGFPLTPKEMREIAFEYTDENNLSGFSDDKEIGGYKWFYGFMTHHDELHVKNGITNLSLACAPESSQCIIDQWFDMYQCLLEQLNIMDPKYIWNIHEHGSEDMAKVKRVIGIKGIK